MNRIFLGLAVANGSLLVVCFVVGLIASAEPRGPGHPPAVWHGTHFLLGLVTTMFTLLVQSIVYTYFLGTNKWVKEVVHVYGMPEWVESESKRNKKKAFRFEFNCMALVGIAAWLGAGADAQGLNPTWHLAAASITLAFNLAAYFPEYAVIVAQMRLLLEVKARADAQRAAAEIVTSAE
ncbi:MAG: hypothetical protein SFX72_20165 [Isosphaeraceae bacterium]|nr:hypothetical protein [Isosphaeraceae bacterium]